MKTVTISRAKQATTVTVRKHKKCKNACKLGSKCPYKHEYQHQLEFSHDDDGLPKNDQVRERFPGKGYRLNNSNTNHRVDLIREPMQLENVRNSRSILIGSQSRNKMNTERSVSSSSSVESDLVTSNESKTDFDTDLNYAIQLSLSYHQTNTNNNSSSSSSAKINDATDILVDSSINSKKKTNSEEIIDLT